MFNYRNLVLRRARRVSIFAAVCPFNRREEV